MSRHQHSIQCRARAREHMEAGWTLQEVRRLLTKEGFDPVPTAPTLSRWRTDRREEKHRRANRERARRTVPATYRYPGVRSPEWLYGRMRSLHAAGLRSKPIAVVLTHDHGVTITENQIRHALKQDSPTFGLRAFAEAIGAVP